MPGRLIIRDGALGVGVDALAFYLARFRMFVYLGTSEDSWVVGNDYFSVA